MDTDADSVRERAYLIWETEGRPDGRDLEHWLQAEREVAQGNGAATAAKSKRRAPARKPVARVARTRKTSS